MGKEYNLFAAWYDTFLEPVLGAMREQIVDMIPPNTSVLEVACGTGAQGVRFKRIDADYTGIDVSADMLKMADKKKLNCIMADGSNLPWNKAEFDVATISLALHEMEPKLRKSIISEMFRITKPDGIIIIADYMQSMDGGVLTALSKGVIYTIERIAGGSHYRNFKHFMTIGGLFGFLKEMDLHAIKTNMLYQGNLAVVKIGKGV